MTIVQVEDSRNVEWKTNNKGSALLQKMGWSEGQGIGKRSTNTTALRAMKRQEGLGLGAKLQTEGGPLDSTDTFVAVLKNLQAHHHGGENKHKTEEEKSPKSSSNNSIRKDKKSKKKKMKKRLILPQNKVTAGHAQKMRLAKFGAKSADDLACIFGSKDVAIAAAVTTIPVPQCTMSSVATVPEPAVSSDAGSVDVKEKKVKNKKKSKKRKLDTAETNESTSSTEEYITKDLEKGKKKRKTDKEEKKSRKKRSSDL